MQNNKNIQHQKQPAFLQAAFIFILICGIFFAAWGLGFYTCPSRSVFGIPCPLCGVSRAFFSLFSGNLRAAFYYHPLWPVILLSLILYVLYFFGIIKPPKHVFNAACFLLVILLLCCFIFRHMTGSPVVKIHFDESLIGRFLRLFS